MTSRELVLGEWTPVVRDPLDVLRGVFVVGAVALAAAGQSGAIPLAVAAAAVVGVRFLDLPRPFDLAFILAMALTGWGEALRLYDRFGYYDVFVHFLVPLFGAPCVYIALARLDTLPDPADASGSKRHLTGIFVVTLALGLGIGAVWEILEWSSDQTLGSNLSLGEQDTIGDLVADGAGALGGGLFLVAWATFGWGTVRRLPGGAESRDD
ncbi:MAG: hypothetical protein ACRDOG_11505 [Gaiellaceae bacterium]